MRKVGTKLIILVRFDVSLHKPIASMLDLLYLCKIMCGGGYEVIDKRNN